METKQTATTRYLCASAHLNRKFRHEAIRQLLEEEHCGAPLSHGVDMNAVLRHCLAARQRSLGRDYALVVLGAIGLIFLCLALRQNVPADSQPAGLGGFLDHWLDLATNSISDSTELNFLGVVFVVLKSIWVTISTFFQTLNDYTDSNTRTLVFAFIGTTWLAAWPFVSWEMWIGRYRMAVGMFGRVGHDPYQLAIRPGRRWQSREERYVSPQDDGQLHEKVATEGNVIIYRGFSPFVGAGLSIGGWSFTLHLNSSPKARRSSKQPNPLPSQAYQNQKTPENFTMQELHSFVISRLQEMDLPDLSISEKLFVSGRHVREDTDFLPDPLRAPRSVVALKIVQRYCEHPTQSVRHCTCLRIEGQSDVVLSVFIRFWRVGTVLFAETSYFVLPPLRREFRIVEEMTPRPSDLQTYLRRLWVAPLSLALTPFMLARAPFVIFSEVAYIPARWLSSKLSQVVVRETPMFDYGVKSSLRENASASTYSEIFQKLDCEMHTKIIERQIFDALHDFLDARGIDTRDLKQKQDAIINQGLIMYGGHLRATNLAVGRKSKISSQGQMTLERPSNPLPAVAEPARRRIKRGKRTT